jgi:hypothetical protein
MRQRPFMIEHRAEIAHVEPTALSRDRIPRDTVIRKRLGVQPIDETEHFFKCDACGVSYLTKQKLLNQKVSGGEQP